MATGERIKFLRKLRGMTQKYLGLSIGFDKKAADVRMAQYESGTRKPKENLVKDIANTLEVSPHALTVPNIDSYIELMHTFFALEDFFALFFMLPLTFFTIPFPIPLTLSKSSGDFNLVVFLYLIIEAAFFSPIPEILISSALLAV